MRNLQIDVVGPEPDNKQLIRCKIVIDGRTCLFWTSQANYEALMYDGVFLRNGKTKDSSGILNTTKLFTENV